MVINKMIEMNGNSTELLSDKEKEDLKDYYEENKRLLANL